jgi:hypothetical protein
MMMSFFAEAGKEEFKQIQQWNHGNKEIYSIIYGTVINNDGHILFRLGKQMKSIYITPKDVVDFGFLGQGPSDIYMPLASCKYFEDIAYLEMTAKIKIFTKKDNTYAWKETKSFKSPITPICKSLLFYNDKWFLAGVITQSWNISKKLNSYFLFYAFDNNGERLKGLLPGQAHSVFREGTLDYFMSVHKSRILVMVENELKVIEIDPNRIEVLRETMLEVPLFYVKMPQDFYIETDSKNITSDLAVEVEKWKTSYSIITNTAVENGYLTVQVRTCSDKLKKFALLFYNADTFKLEKTFFINDFFIGSRDGIYYFYANGNPGYDEEADECIINLYSFTEKNERNGISRENNYVHNDN